LSLLPHPLPTLFPYTTLFRSPLPEPDVQVDPDCLVLPRVDRVLEPHGDREVAGVRRRAVLPTLVGSVPGSGRFAGAGTERRGGRDRKSTRLNSSHQIISYAVF